MHFLFGIVKQVFFLYNVRDSYCTRVGTFGTESAVR